MSNNEKIYKDLIAFHPGAYIEEIVEDLNITQQEFAQRLGLSPKTVSKLVNGEESISKETANKLAKLTGVSIVTWLNLQNAYDMKVIEIEESQNEDEENICRLVDFTYFKKNKFVEDKKYTIKEKVEELRKLLHVSSLSYLYDFNYLVSYRHTKDFSEKSIVNSNIMLELAINSSKDKTDNKFNRKKLGRLLPELRKMTLQEPQVFYPVLKKKLLECGIILFALPALKNADLNGATKKFRNGSILLLVTDRKKGADIFWFSLFHELGHIIENDFYSDHEDKNSYQEKERKADEFAENFLIPENNYLAFRRQSVFTKETILKFSSEIKIHPSIILGRLQNDELVAYNRFPELRQNYNIVVH